MVWLGCRPNLPRAPALDLARGSASGLRHLLEKVDENSALENERFSAFSTRFLLMWRNPPYSPQSPVPSCGKKVETLHPPGGEIFPVLSTLSPSFPQSTAPTTTIT